MTQSLNERHALVTGAGSGIGAAIAMSLAHQGCRLTLAGRSQDALQKQAECIHREVPDASVVIAALDVTDLGSVQAGLTLAESRLGPVNILVNNAGQAESQPFLRTDSDLWQRTLAVNLTGTYHMTHAALPGMLESAAGGNPGRIIMVASTAGLMGYPYVSAYAAAKHGVIGLTRSLALELARKNITVNAVCPGYTETAIVALAVDNIVAKTGQTPEQARQALASRNPMQRLIQPEEVANTVVWLCMPGSASVNGQAIAVDGGEQAG
jgi:NAD(P)-dependent dehydrogenase (short-subunit alcohol dehydrogenase family)